MKQKNKLVMLAMLALTVASTTFVGCKKYEDGPTISLRTRTQRVANTWKIENYTYDGTDLTSLVTGYTETFTTDNNYSYKWGILSGTGKWSFQNKDAEIKVYDVNGQSAKVLIILKLEEKSFWYKTIDGSKTSVYHMIPN